MEAAIIWGSFFIAGMLFSVFELRSPARRVSYRTRLLTDIRAFAIVFLFFIVVSVLSSPLAAHVAHSTAVDALRDAGLFSVPEPLRFIVFFALWDFVLYWVHRFMHLERVWPIHRWHHSPTQLWWLVGVRGSLPHILITFLPFLLFNLFGLPVEYGIAAAIVSVVGNAWMHVNMRHHWMRYLEYLFVTPRFHSLHHINEKQFANVNFGSLLSVWDRAFGTYVDPDAVDNGDGRPFGIWDDPGFLRMILGLK